MKKVDDSRVRGLYFQMRGFPKKRSERFSRRVKKMRFAGIQCFKGKLFCEKEECYRGNEEKLFSGKRGVLWRE